MAEALGGPSGFYNGFGDLARSIQQKMVDTFERVILGQMAEMLPAIMEMVLLIDSEPFWEKSLGGSATEKFMLYGKP